MTASDEKLNCRKGVVICGAYGMGNAGDEAILHAIVGELRSLDPDLPITVLSRRPEETARRHQVKSIFTFSMLKVYRAMRGARLFISGGGSLIQDATSSRSLLYYLHTIRAAKARGCRVMMYGCGVGPVTRGGNARRAGRTIDACVDKITLREKDSADVIRSWNVTRPEILLSADPVTALPLPESGDIDREMVSRGLRPDGRYVAFCLRDWDGFDAVAASFGEAAAYLSDTYGLTPVFLSVNHRSDGEAAARAAARLKAGTYVMIQDPLPADTALGLMSRMSLCISIRLHGLIFAAASGVPAVGVSYDPKVSAFISYLGQGACADLSGITGEKLISMAESALSADRTALKEAAGVLREKEKQNLRSAASLLKEEK